MKSIEKLLKNVLENKKFNQITDNEIECFFDSMFARVRFNLKKDASNDYINLFVAFCMLMDRSILYSNYTQKEDENQKERIDKMFDMLIESQKKDVANYQ